MKSMIIDRLVLLGSSWSRDESGFNDVEDADGGERLPEKWLASSRVTELEIHNVQLSNCFLCGDPLEGQEDFLVALTVRYSSLNGYLCTACKNDAVVTKSLHHLKTLEVVDFSFNSLQTVAGQAFPGSIGGLRKIVLSHNNITKVYDNAFSNLYRLKELNLSHNRLSSISRKIFRRPNDTMLCSLDLSWNSIAVLQEDIFEGMKALKEVKLGHNLLVVLSEKTFNNLPANIEKIDVKGNFLTCNCSLSWIVKLRSGSAKISGKCVSPKEVQFHDIKSTLSSLRSCRNPA